MYNDTDFLYVKNVIEPLEQLIRRIQRSNEVSVDEVKELNRLLYEKYLVLEQILTEMNEYSEK